MTTPRKGVAEMNGESACPVCFKDVEIFSVGVCDHPICHECSTRMRVLCKEDACPICRQDLNKVAFIKEVKPYQQLNFNSYLVDKNTRIHFENVRIQEVYENLLIHVCQLCPSKPSYASLQMLKDHLRKEHEMFFCDLCVEHLKIFSQERRAYTRQELALHRRKGDPDNTSHRGHPLCNFCDKRYVDADELFRHLRRDHYFCHFCDADGLNHYYCAYEDLREHFRDAHFLCEESECKEEKFTCVFRTEIDIRAHKAQMHSLSLGKAAVKQARTLELDFTLAPRSGQENKLRVGGRGAAKVPDKQDQHSNSNENHDFRVSGPCVNADIRNPEEFPSLTVSSQSVTKQSVPLRDSLAKKLAKSNRFTVKNVFGSQDEFPSLVTPNKEVKISVGVYHIKITTHMAYKIYDKKIFLICLQKLLSLRDKKILPVEEFPSLVSSYVEPTKNSSGKLKDKNPKLQVSSQPRTVIDKSNVKISNTNSVQSSKNKSGEKISDFQSFEIGMNPNENSNSHQILLAVKLESLNLPILRQ
uniref:RING-type E3 ubiquitin transferase n=1 Tax=Scapholeberis mucronata TaxID=202097 RepID=A0A4Y7NJP8_9CRUS|nr:EOG090X01BP [Scapholeberis mucronata]